jgi:hypothetical protein
MPPHLFATLFPKRMIHFPKRMFHGFRTVVDRADDPQARAGAGAALVLPQPVPCLPRPVSLRRVRGILTPFDDEQPGREIRPGLAGLADAQQDIVGA